MDFQKGISGRFLLALTVLVLGGVSTLRPFGWETITSFKDVRRMRVIDDTLFLATSGGILAVTDPLVPGLMYTNLDGLGTADITDIIVDAEGQKWVTGYGQFVRFGGPSPERFPTLPVYGMLNLCCVVDDGDGLWLGSDSGLILFTKAGVAGAGFADKYPITLVNPFPPVYDIWLEDSLIWLATGNGLAFADRREPDLLKAPANWTVFDVASNPELATSVIRRVTRYEDSLYVITGGGAFHMSIDGADTSFTESPFASSQTFYDMRVDSDSLFIYYSGGLALIKDGAIMAIPTPGAPTAKVTGVNTGDVRWVVADRERGVYYDQGGSFRQYAYTGTPGNRVTDVAIDRDGTMFGGFLNQRAARRAGELWVTLPYEPRHYTTVLTSDGFGYTWIGTEGGGLWRTDGTALINFNDTNSTIIGNEAAHSFAWVSGVRITGGYLFASLYYTYNGYPVAVARLDGTGYPVQWDSLGLEDGISNDVLQSVDYYDGVLAVGSRYTGVYYCGIGPDPLDKSDDFCVNFQKANSFLPSDAVKVVRFSPEGELWAGTNFGLSRLDESLGQVGEIGRWVDVNLPAGVGPEITALEFDSRGNAWIGARNGLVRFDASEGTFELFNTLNSGLVGNEISNLTLDAATGNLYVSTGSGLSKYLSATGGLTPVLDSVLAYPNPFVIRSADDRLQFSFAGRYTVHVFNVAGELVWEVTDLSDESWDGRNQRGEPVASGVYLFVLKDADGKVARGKFLLVRDQ
ncbi:MAG TPA: gliding motility-associated C-terminal domain-containing protein [Acidobacteriota bacterium]|nr:gliding motility-associated C-terminal domain-containing protein [Acidobacteriota bacterium]